MDYGFAIAAAFGGLFGHSHPSPLIGRPKLSRKHRQGPDRIRGKMSRRGRQYAVKGIRP